MAIVLGAQVIDRVLYLQLTGEDTYITVPEANDYISRYKISTDPLRVQWEAMEDVDKEILLHKAYTQINSLPFNGKPKSPTQTEPFPRAGDFTPNDLLKVKYAQVEQALMLSDMVNSQEYSDRMRLRRAGVSSYRIGDLSETFHGSLYADGGISELSGEAYKYLSKWLRGGYKICTSTKKHCGRQ